MIGGRESGAIQLSWGAKASRTKTLRKATATETTARGTLLPPFFPPHRFARFPTFPLPPLLTNTPGCDPPAGGCPDLCLCSLPTRGLLLLLLLRAPHPRIAPASPRSCRRRDRRLLSHLPRTRAPSFPSRAASPAPPAPPPPRGTFVSRGTFCLFPVLRLAGRPASPADQSCSEHRRRRRLYLSAPAEKQLADTHTPTEPRKSPGDPGSSLDPKDDRRTLAPRAAPPRSTSRPGLSLPRPQQPPPPPLSHAASRPRGRPDTRGKRGADAGRQLTSKSGDRGSRGEARRREAQGEATPRTPAETGCRSGSQRPADVRRLRAQASAATAAFRISPRVRSLGRGRGCLTRCQVPRSTWLPRRRAARTAH